MINLRYPQNDPVSYELLPSISYCGDLGRVPQQWGSALPWESPPSLEPLTVPLRGASPPSAFVVGLNPCLPLTCLAREPHTQAGVRCPSSRQPAGPTPQLPFRKPPAWTLLASSPGLLSEPHWPFELHPITFFFSHLFSALHGSFNTSMTYFQGQHTIDYI